MIDFTENQVIEWQPERQEREPDLYRILFVDYLTKQVVLFNLREEGAIPRTVDLEVLNAAVQDELLRTVEFRTPKNFLMEEEISDKSKDRRDWAWGVIAPLVTGEGVPAIFDERHRGEMIMGIVTETRITHKTIYRLLRQYWSGGLTKNSLLPDHCVRKRTATYQRAVKNGRRSLRERIDSELTGIVIDEKVKSNFRNAIRLWYLNENRYPLTKVYLKMLGKYFNMGYQVVNAELTPILKPVHERPTMRQFRYFVDEEMDSEKKLRARLGERRFNLSHRPVLGSTDHIASGPGQFYQIDATIADVYLVHRINREWCIGKPVLYFVVDVFSRMITGMYIGLEGPSWLGAMMALENACSDKVEYCAQHGIKIEPEDWPAHHLPDHFTADRGEMLGKKPENFIETLWVDIENLPAYRPDWKPIVERQFKTTEEIIKWLAGGIKERNLERGKRHWAEDALYDLEEFEQLMIYEVLRYNNFHAISAYPRDKNMIIDDVPPVPVHLWNWGRSRGYGQLRQIDRDILRLNLLPMETVTVSAKGIPFHGRHYVCPTAIKENWFVRDGRKREVRIHYDPRSVDKIFLRLDNGRKYEECTLVYIYSRYKGLRDEEAFDLLSYEREMTRNIRDEEMQMKVFLETKQEALEKSAIEKRNNTATRKVTRDDMREHRKDERLNKQKEEAWTDLKNNAPAANNVVEFPARGKSNNNQPDYSELITDIIGLDEDDTE